MWVWLVYIFAYYRWCIHVQTHACSDVHCVYSSDYTDIHTDHMSTSTHTLTNYVIQCHACTHTHTRHTEPTLTVDNLTTVFDSVPQWNMISIANLLDIPNSKQYQLQQNYGSELVNNTAYADYIIGHHPCPSWTMVANALWYWKESGALEMVQKLYLKGEPCAHSCRSEGRIILSVFELIISISWHNLTTITLDV